MKRIIVALALYLLPGICMAQPRTSTPPANFDTSGLATIGRVVSSANALFSNTIYSTSITTFSSATYTASKGSQPCPSVLTAGQVYNTNFNVSNTGAVSFNPCGLGSKPIKLLSSGGTLLNLTGGEIVVGPATLPYDGSEFVLYGIPAPRVITVASGSVTLTQANFSAHDIILCTGNCTLVMPLSTTLSVNSNISIAAPGAVATITLTGSDVVAKNSSLSVGTTTTVIQSAQVFTNTTTGFWVLGT